MLCKHRRILIGLPAFIIFSLSFFPAAERLHAATSIEADDDEVTALSAGVAAPKARIQSYIARAWPSVRETLHRWVDDATDAVDSDIIYNLQIQIASLLDYAVETHDSALLNDIERLYARMLDPRFLSQKNEYKFWSGYDAEGNYRYEIVPTREYEAWLDGQETEGVLGSSQFMYAVARLTAGLSHDDTAMEKYAPLIEDFYTRMVLGMEPGTDNGVFQHRGYGCIISRWEPVERFNHKAYIAYLAEKRYKGNVSYCNAMSDTDMWIMAGTLEMLALEREHPASFHLTDQERSALSQYVFDAANLLRSRFSAKTVKFAGKKYASLVLDPGSWKDHPENAFAGYEGAAFPDTSGTRSNPVPAGLSWDVSHGRRLVQVMETFYRHAALTGGAFPTATDMRRIANQVAFGTFRGSLQLPKFTNFLDGSNGWFRVNYSGRTGFGYYPFAQSSSFAAGGYCRFVRYNRDIHKICNGIYNLTVAKSAKLVEHRRNIFEYCYMNNYEKQYCDSFDYKNNNVSLLNFYASLL